MVSELHRLGAGNVSPGRAPDRIARGGVRRRAAVRVLSVPVRALQPLRAADDLLHAAGAAGAASVRERPRAPRDAVLFGLLAAGAALLLDVLRRVLHGVCRSPLRRACAWLTRPPLRRMLGPAAIAGALALLLALPLARTYSAAHLGDRDVDDRDLLQRHRRRLSPRAPAQCDVGRADAAGAHARARALSRRHDPAAGGGRADPAARRRPARPTLSRSWSLFEISRGFNSAFYPYLYDWLPFIRGLRVPARASILVGLTLALLAGFGVRRLLAGTIAVVAARRAGGAGRRDRRSTCGRCCGSNLSGSSRRPSTVCVCRRRDVVLAEFPFGGNPTPLHSRTCRSCTSRCGTGRR